MNLAYGNLHMLNRSSQLRFCFSTSILPSNFNSRQLSSLPHLQQRSLSNATLQLKRINTQNISKNWQFIVSKSLSNTTKVVNEERVKPYVNITKISDSYEKKLENIETILGSDLKHIFDSRTEYRIYTADVLFENRWRPENPKITKGITKYVLQVLKSRFYFHFLFPKLKVVINRSRLDLDEGLVVFDWQIKVLKTAAMLKIKEVSPSIMKKKANESSRIMEGNSTFYVNEKGFIYKHVLEKGHRLATNESKDGDEAVQSEERESQKAL